jgi:hypothetical protein
MSNQLRGCLQISVGLVFLLAASAGIYFGQLPIGQGSTVSFSDHPVVFVAYDIIWYCCALWALQTGQKTRKKPDNNHYGA